MTVLDTVQGQVKPGRFDDFMAQSGEAHKLFDRLGAKSPRLSVGAVTGGPMDTFVFSTEFENGEAWGEFSDRLATDVEFQAFVTRTRSVDSPTTIDSISTSVEIPLREGNRQRGNVVEVHVTRPVPGRFDDGLAQATKVLELVEARGATNARLFQMGYAGAGSGLTMISWEFENLKALGRLGDLWATDPELVDIAVSRFATDAPTTPVFDGIYQVLPI